MSERRKVVLFDARPHPRGEGETLAASSENLRLGWLESRSRMRMRPHAVPSPGGEGQGEGGRFTIQSEPTHVGCYESR